MGKRAESRQGKQGLIIAIDGPSGVGKSTVARLLALRMGYLYLDTGALYRAVAWKVRDAGLGPDDREAITALLPEMTLRMACGPEQAHVLVDGRDITGELRTPAVTALASMVSAIPAVREWLLPVQRQISTERLRCGRGTAISELGCSRRRTLNFFSRPIRIFVRPGDIVNSWRQVIRVNWIRPSAILPVGMIATGPERCLPLVPCAGCRAYRYIQHARGGWSSSK